jgi:SAM-dependent methyltransferase
MLDLRSVALTTGANVSERRRAAAHAYNLPYRWKKPKNVLILGAGTGNDVAAAIRHGAERVDAVEIDPLINRLGREHHPERPYDDARVRVVIDDARAFLKRPGETYDMIVFGLLDSHLGTFSSVSSSIRLDNYVYTVESIRSALARLTPDGLLALSVYCEQPWIATRLEAMVREAWGRSPLTFHRYYDRGVLYLAGPGAPDRSEAGTPTALDPAFVEQHPPGPMSTDAWPFLYLEGRMVPGTVLWAAAVVILVTIGLVSLFFRGDVRFDRHLFFLGAGFLLVETRTIAQLGLLFGTVWRVSALTIGFILAIILLANAFVEKRGALPRLPLYILLAIGLTANYLVPTGAVLGAGLVARLLMAAFLVLPLLFASLIFASSIRERKALPPALASNLVGAVLGGVLENAAMVVGFPALSLIAIVVYAASYRK